MIILGGEAFGRRLGLKGGMDLEIYKRASRKTSIPFYLMRTQQEGPGSKQGRWHSPESEHAGNLILGFPASRPVRNKFLLFLNHLMGGNLLSQFELRMCYRKSLTTYQSASQKWDIDK